jgi:beta-galactosidase
MRRDSQNFPASGLRWEVAFARGISRLRAIASKGEVTVVDKIELIYQTEPWDNPTQLKLTKGELKSDIVTVEARLLDAKGVLCLDSSSSVRFSLTGAGTLIDNLGTTRASRELQLSNGRAEISVVRRATCTIEATPEGMAAASLKL